MQWIAGPVALRRRLDQLQPTPVRCSESSYGFCADPQIGRTLRCQNAADECSWAIKRLVRSRTTVA